MRFMVRIVPVLLAVVSAQAVLAQGADRQLLGIPFGAKLQLAKCPANTDKATRPCWLDRPFLYKPTGSLSGPAFLPGPGARPAWAAYAMFNLTLDRAGLVQEIKVSTVSNGNRAQISESISRRFGQPYENFLSRPDIGWASWRSGEGSVILRCQSDCVAEFRTPEAQAARDAELAARAKKDAARPNSP